MESNQSFLGRFSKAFLVLMTVAWLFESCLCAFRVGGWTFIVFPLALTMGTAILTHELTVRHYNKQEDKEVEENRS